MCFKKVFINSFTLIELIVVIVIIGILTAIIVPNVSNFKKEASLTATQNNVRNLQTSSDMYSLDFQGLYPTFSQPEIGVPQPIDFKKINPKYTRTLPKDKPMKYWVDYQGKVWASTVDSPTKVINDGSNLTWIDTTGAVAYNVYEVVEDATGSAANSKQKLSFVKKITGMTSYQTNNHKEYAVSSLDDQGFETPPVSSKYEGYDHYIVVKDNPLENSESNTSEGQIEAPGEVESPSVPTLPVTETPKLDGRYLVIDTEGTWGYDSYTTITEIDIFDMEGNVIPYIPVFAYDSETKNVPSHWNSTSWGKTNLYDNSIYYADNPSGNQSSMVWGSGNSPLSVLWGRLALDLQSEEQIGKIVIYAGSPEKRIPKTISVYSADTLDNIKNINLRNNEGLTLVKSFAFDGTELTVRPYEIRHPDFVDTPNTQLENMYKGTRYLLFELDGKYNQGDLYATISEIELFDKNGVKIPFTPTDRYDGALGTFNFWTSGSWSRLNLNDGDINYISNATGGTSSTVFYGASTTNYWARFLVDLGAEKEVGSIKVWAGSPEKRNAKIIKAYKVHVYDYASQLKNRVNTNLEFLGQTTIPENQYTVEGFLLQ